MRWHRTWRADPRAAAIADRHYSRKRPGTAQFAPPGRCFVLVTAAADALWVTTWQRPEYTEHGLGDVWLCTIFRNEGAGLSSELIREALAATRAAWGDPPADGPPACDVCGKAGGTFTFIDTRKVRRKRDPGRCFIRAGFHRLDRLTKDRGLVILHLPPAEHPVAAEALGSQLALS